MTVGTGNAAQLAEQTASDLDAAFGQIVTTHGPAVYTTARRVSLQRADADDLAAETFVRAYKALSGYSPERIRALRMRAWLVTITLNLWRNQLRDTSRRPSLVPLEASATRSDPAGGPEQAALDRCGSSAVEALLADLAEDQRVPIVLRHVVGLSYTEIAEVLGCPAGTAKSHVSRGLATLRAQLHPDEEAMP